MAKFTKRIKIFCYFPFSILFTVGKLDIYSLVFAYSLIALVLSSVSVKFLKELLKGSSFYLSRKEVILHNVSPVLQNSIRSIKVLKEAWPFGLSSRFLSNLSSE